MPYSGYATGQFSPGALSGADAQTTTTSSGELLYFQSGGQPIIALSPAFVAKAESAGITLQQTPNGLRYVSNTAQLPEMQPNQPNQSFNLFPILLIGAAVALLSK